MNWLVEKMKEDGSKNAIIFKGKEYTYEALVEQIESYYIIGNYIQSYSLTLVKI